jgi:hypothetical protein
VALVTASVKLIRRAAGNARGGIKAKKKTAADIEAGGEKKAKIVPAVQVARPDAHGADQFGSLVITLPNDAHTMPAAATLVSLPVAD